MTWYVYLLECSDDSLYTGITNNLAKRMKTHKSGKGSKYVKSKGFSQLLHALETDSKSTAAQIEYQVKQMQRNDKITFFVNHPNKILKYEDI